MGTLSRCPVGGGGAGPDPAGRWPCTGTGSSSGSPLFWTRGPPWNWSFACPSPDDRGQRFQLCLQDVPLPDRGVQRGGPPGSPHHPGHVPGVSRRATLERRAVSFADGFAFQRVDLPPHLSSDDWIHPGAAGPGRWPGDDGPGPGGGGAKGVVRLSSAPGSQWRIGLLAARPSERNCWCGSSGSGRESGTGTPPAQHTPRRRSAGVHSKPPSAQSPLRPRSGGPLGIPDGVHIAEVGGVRWPAPRTRPPPSSRLMFSPTDPHVGQEPSEPVVGLDVGLQADSSPGEGDVPGGLWPGHPRGAWLRSGASMRIRRTRVSGAHTNGVPVDDPHQFAVDRFRVWPLTGDGATRKRRMRTQQADVGTGKLRRMAGGRRAVGSKYPRSSPEAPLPGDNRSDP